MTSPSGHNILIVDDSSTIRAFMRRAISLSGVATDNVYEAADGKQALELISQKPVDVVLADLHMPGMGGEEMSHRIFDDPTRKNISVVVVSADPNEQRIQSLLKAGAKGYLAKPFTPESFCTMLFSVLGEARHD